MEDLIKILVIDPNVVFAKRIRSLVKHEHCKVFAELTGEDGLLAAAKHKAELVFLNVKIPGMDGIEICRRLKMNPSNDPMFVTLISDVEMNTDEQALGFEEGAGAFITSALSDRELMARIKAYSRLIRNEKTLRQDYEYYAEIFETISDGVGLTTLAGNVLAINKPLEKMLELPKEDIEGKNILHLTKNLLNPKNILTALPSLERILQGKETDPFRIEYKNKILEISSRYNSETKRLTGIFRDLTEIKRKEEAIKATEQNYRSLFENIQDVLFRIDAEGVIREISPSIFRYSGYTKEELIGKPAAEVYYNPEERVSLLKELQNRGGVVNDFDVRFETKHGQSKWASLNVRMLLDEDGNPRGVEGSLRDVTKRKQVENSLKESEAKFRSFFENSPIGIEIYDQDGIQIAANKASLQMFGITDESSAGFNLFNGTSLNDELKEKLHKGDTIAYQVFFDFDRVTAMNQYKTNRTGKAAMDYVITPVKSTDDGSVLAYLLQVQDITDRLRDEKIQKVLYNISNAVFITRDLEDLIGIIQLELGTLLDTTNFFVAFYNEETGMLSCSYMQDEQDKIEEWPAEKSMTGVVVRTNKPLLADRQEIMEMNKRGEIDLIGAHAQCWLGVPIHANGKVTGAFVVQSYQDPKAYTKNDVEMLEFVSHQISHSIQRKKTEKDLQLAKEKAQESDRLKSAFLANMSHEIRTPMNGIVGFANLLKRKDLTKEKQESFIEVINSSSKQLLAIISDIVDISKIETNQVNIIKKPVDLCNIVRNVYNNLLMLSQKNENLTLILREQNSNKEYVIYTDEVKLQQILSNLVENAIKFTENGKVEFGYKINANNEIEFFVKDSGFGIAEDHFEIIFDRFRKIEKKELQFKGGSGLGLAISKSYVELLGGKIWLESKLGYGTTFHFTIPNETGEKA